MIRTLTNQAPGALLAASVASPAPVIAEPVAYKTIKVRELDIFYREAGPKMAPAVLLLHGFPSSSHMFRDLIPKLATRYRVVAPDYPGFGYSSAPSPQAFEYTFANVADVMADFTRAVGLSSYALYMQDYGGPVGMRLAVMAPDKVRGLVVQNAVISADGWNGQATAPLAAFWKARNSETEAAARTFLAAPTTQFQYTHGETRTDRLNPDAWTFDQSRLDRPGNDLIQLELLYQYQDNILQYPAWQQYLNTRQPPVLVVWGRNDPFFTGNGLEAYRSLVPKAEVHTFDAGHFALETHGDEISQRMLAFLDRLHAAGN